MIRYDNICAMPNSCNLIDYSIPESNFTESLADFSAFVPTSESVRTLKVGNINVNGMFDFVDGKDTGMQVPVSRVKGVDIAQISTDLRKQQDKFKQALQDAKDFQELKATLQSKISNSSNTTDSAKATD